MNVDAVMELGRSKYARTDGFNEHSTLHVGSFEPGHLTVYHIFHLLLPFFFIDSADQDRSWLCLVQSTKM